MPELYLGHAYGPIRNKQAGFNQSPILPYSFLTALPVAAGTSFTQTTVIIVGGCFTAKKRPAVAGRG